MKQTKEQAKEKASEHQEKLSEMTPEQHLVHISGAALALYSRLTQQLGPLQMMVPQEDWGTTEVTVPMPALLGMVEVVGELLSILRDHKIIDPDEVEAYVRMKQAEADAAHENGETCPGCGQVHDSDETNPIRRAAQVIAAMMAAHRGELDDSEAPPGATKH